MMKRTVTLASLPLSSTLLAAADNDPLMGPGWATHQAGIVRVQEETQQATPVWVAFLKRQVHIPSASVGY